MTSPRSWRTPAPLTGPMQARVEDIGPLNVVFSDAFSERYRKDGMVGVRVPHLNPQIWRYAIEDAAEGAMLWRDARGEIAAFNMVHRSGVEGWMGPLAVRTEFQGHGTGKLVVDAGIRWLRSSQSRVIGLETMPRTMDNIGFYSSLGFSPGSLTITLTLDAESSDRAPELFGRLSLRDRDEQEAEIRELVMRMASGYDYSREILLTDALALGDTLLLRDRGVLCGFALCHTAPLVEGRAREELRVLKMALSSDENLGAMIRALRDFSKRSGTRRVAIRVQGQSTKCYRALIDMGARVRWTDLRMSLDGFPELAPAHGMLLSNWEI